MDEEGVAVGWQRACDRRIVREMMRLALDLRACQNGRLAGWGRWDDGEAVWLVCLLGLFKSGCMFERMRDTPPRTTRGVQSHVELDRCADIRGGGGRGQSTASGDTCICLGDGADRGNYENRTTGRMSVPVIAIHGNRSPDRNG